MRVAFLGPAGTFSHEALLASPGAPRGDAARPYVYDAVLAVHDGAADRALVPIENSLEGSVNATLDALAFEADDVAIVGELVHPVRHCLIARGRGGPRAIRTVVSHPQASGQCARFIRTRLGAATVVPAASTADAVRLVAEGDLPAGTPAARARGWPRSAYGCEVILDGVEDAAGNATVHLGRAAPLAPPLPGGARPPRPPSCSGARAPSRPAGWCAACPTSRSRVNLTRIESRPLKQGLGQLRLLPRLRGLDGRSGGRRGGPGTAASRRHGSSPGSFET